MKVLVTGATGQVGYDVVKELKKRGHDPIATGRKSKIEKDENEVWYLPLDITNRKKVTEVLKTIQPDAVIHCAAWTDVDLAEEKENQTKVNRINVTATWNLADACAEIDCKLLYLSTDYVFNGKGSVPWTADCKEYQPLNFYGLSKLNGEKMISHGLEKYFIVRISWVFGKNGKKNFVKTMLNLSKTHDTIRVVHDQIGSPTYAKDLARVLVDMIESEKYGIYHATNEGDYISWYDFACEIYRQAGIPMNVIPVTTEEYGESKAHRPLNSRLDKSKLIENGFQPLPDWQDALQRYLNEIEVLQRVSKEEDTSVSYGQEQTSAFLKPNQSNFTLIRERKD